MQPRMYQGVRICPSGKIRRTRTTSPTWNFAGIDPTLAAARSTPVVGLELALIVARFDIGYLSAQLVDRDHAALNQGLGDGMDPAFVVAHFVVSVGPDRFDVLTQLVD